MEAESENITFGNTTAAGLIYNILEAASSTEHYFLFACYITFGVIGIPANLAVIGTIIRWRRLYFPRNIMWLGVGISNVANLTCFLLRVLFIWWGNSWSTQARLSWFCGLFSASRLLIMLLSSLERHVYLNYSSWYKSHISNRLLLALQSSCFFLVFFMAAAFSQMPNDSNEDFQSGFFTSSNFKTIGTILIGLFPICLTGLFMTARFKIIQENPSIEMAKLGAAPDARPDDGGEMAGTPAFKQPNYFVLIGNKRLSRLEAEAADSVNFSLILFLVIMLPPLVLYSISSACVHIMSANVDTCIPYAWYFFYTSTFLNALYSSIVNVIFFVLYNHDLRSLYSRRTLNSLD